MDRERATIGNVKATQLLELIHRGGNACMVSDIRTKVRPSKWSAIGTSFIRPNKNPRYE
jgi:hypothetical protein